MKLIAPIEKAEDIVNKQYVDNKVSTKVEDTEIGISTTLDKISNNTTNATDTDVYITKVNNKYYKRSLSYLWNWIKTKVEALGYTKNKGTLTGIKMNGVSKGTSGVVDLGTVLTGGSQTTTSTEDGGNNVYTFSDNSTITVKNGTKGSTGAAAGFGTPTATVDANTGTPSVTVTATGPNTAKVFNFAFKNLKGEKGDIGEIDVVSSSANGLAPKITNTNAFLKGDGTWSIPADSKIKISSLNPAAATWYYPIWSASTSGTTAGNINDGFMYNTSQGTAEKLGHSYLKIGNATASGTEGNKRGHLRIYGENSGYSELISNAATNRVITFPNASGTVSLNGHTHPYLPLSGGSVTGDISRKSDSNVDGYYRAERTDLTFTDSKGNKQHEDIRFGISNGANRGIWDRRLEKWLVRADTSGNVYFGDPAYADKTTIRGRAIIRIAGSLNTNINISSRKHALIIATKVINIDSYFYTTGYYYIDDTTPASSIAPSNQIGSSQLVLSFSLTKEGIFNAGGICDKFDIILFD